jgi:hypothetical protein
MHPSRRKGAIFIKRRRAFAQHDALAGSVAARAFA